MSKHNLEIPEVWRGYVLGSVRHGLRLEPVFVRVLGPAGLAGLMALGWLMTGCGPRGSVDAPLGHAALADRSTRDTDDAPSHPLGTGLDVAGGFDPTGSWTVREAAGDWDDVEAAVLAALSRCSMTFERRDSTFPPESEQGGRDPADVLAWTYDLLTIQEATGTLKIERGDTLKDGSVAIMVSARIGPLGDPDRERCLVDAISLRLGQLRGVDAAPLRW